MKLRRTAFLTSALAVVALAVAVSSCGSSPVTPPTTLPTPPPTPLPTPVPTPTPPLGACPLGKGEVDAPCAKSSQRLLDAVERAIDTLVRKRPELFDKEQEAGAGTGQYRVLDVEGYLDGLVGELRGHGLCAQRAPFDAERILVKSSNDFSEEWDLVSSSGFIRRGPYAYQSSCRPASFPVEPADYIAYVRTHLWGFECLSGITPPSPGQRTIPVGCDGRVTATPKRTSGRDVPAEIHGPDVSWVLREGDGIVTLETDPRFPDNPFDKVLVTSGKLGGFYVCATVLGKEGCLHGQVIP